MGKTRLEAFSDGVLAIIITIMVLELKVPHGDSLETLLPFATGWMGENHFATLPTAAYGVVLLAAALAYRILQQRIIAAQGVESKLRHAVGADWKGKLSPVLYVAGIGLTFVNSALGQAVYVAVALLWLVPDRRIERSLRE